MPFRYKQIHGYNGVIANAREMVSSYNASVVLPTAKVTTVDVISTDAKDDGSPAGVGAQTITFEYLDSNYAEQTKANTLNGLTAVPNTSFDFIRLNAAYVTAVGSELNNAGVITITDDDQSDIYGAIAAGINCMQQAIYCVPANYTAWIDYLILAGGTYDDEVGIFLVSDKNPTTNLKVSGIVFDQGYWRVAGNSIHIDLRANPIKIPETCTFYFEAIADTDTEIAGVSAFFREVPHVS